jgi:hypothetical protein
VCAAGFSRHHAISRSAIAGFAWPIKQWPAMFGRRLTVRFAARFCAKSAGDDNFEDAPSARMSQRKLK